MQKSDNLNEKKWEKNGFQIHLKVIVKAKLNLVKFTRCFVMKHVPQKFKKQQPRVSPKFKIIKLKNPIQNPWLELKLIIKMNEVTTFLVWENSKYKTELKVEEHLKDCNSISSDKMLIKFIKEFIIKNKENLIVQWYQFLKNRNSLI